MAQTKTGQTEKAGAALRDDASSEDTRRQAAAILGGVRSERKAATSRENGRLSGGRGTIVFRPLLEFACDCGAGETLEGHKSLCPRGKTIRRRQQKGQPLNWREPVVETRKAGAAS